MQHQFVNTPIVKSKGTTKSERHLARLAENSFLNLWSYPNPYRDQKENPKSNGSELCDLLVVCGDNILIFSKKTISWSDTNLKTAWLRWCKKAIIKSTKSVLGAERWISKFPDRVFIDAACTKRFPIQLPPKDRRKIHGIVVAGGAKAACQKHFNGGSGSLVIESRSIENFQNFSVNDFAEPFHIGDLNPTGTYIHVLERFRFRLGHIHLF